MRILVRSLLLVFLLFLVGCRTDTSDFNPFEEEVPEESLPTEQKEEFVPLLTLCGRRYSFTGGSEAISVKDDLLTIRQGGTYRLTGELTEGGLAVEVGWGETVRLILSGASIRSSYHPALSLLSAAAVIVETEQDSVNLLFSEGEAVIDGSTHLILCGEGSLSLSGARSAVRSSGTVEIDGGIVRATASEYGFLSETRLEIHGGEVAVNAAKYGYATRETDPSGGIFVDGGKITSVSSEAALSAHRSILLSGGTGSFDAPVYYECERVQNEKKLKGEILLTGGSFPPIPS